MLFYREDGVTMENFKTFEPEHLREMAIQLMRMGTFMMNTADEIETVTKGMDKDFVEYWINTRFAFFNVEMRTKFPNVFHDEIFDCFFTIEDT